MASQQVIKEALVTRSLLADQITCWSVMSLNANASVAGGTNGCSELLF